MPDEREIRRLAGHTVYRNAWLSVREDDVEFPSGHRGIYGVVEKPDFVVVLPWERDGFWLVEQFRYPVARRVWEFPLGAWPSGRTGTALELAELELAEETGLRAGRFEHLGRLLAVPGVQTNSFDVYLATELSQRAPDREVTEADMVHAWRSWPQLRAMIADGSFPDSTSLAALTLFKLRET